MNFLGCLVPFPGYRRNSSRNGLILQLGFKHQAVIVLFLALLRDLGRSYVVELVSDQEIINVKILLRGRGGWREFAQYQYLLLYLCEELTIDKHIMDQTKGSKF